MSKEKLWFAVYLLKEALDKGQIMCYNVSVNFCFSTLERYMTVCIRNPYRERERR